MDSSVSKSPRSLGSHFSEEDNTDVDKFQMWGSGSATKMKESDGWGGASGVVSDAVAGAGPWTGWSLGRDQSAVRSEPTRQECGS